MGNSESRAEIDAAAIKQCLSAVLKLLEADDAKARRQAVRLLGGLGVVAAPAASALATAANDADPEVRDAALFALTSLGPAAKEAVPHLDALLRDDQARCHPAEVARALLSIDPQADIVPHLLESLGDQRLEVRQQALDVLSALEGRAAINTSAVAELIADENPEVRVEAVTVYSRLADRADAISVLRVALRKEENRGVRRHLARTLVRLLNGPLER
jgi:HEAT repeat protein